MSDHSFHWMQPGVKGVYVPSYFGSDVMVNEIDKELSGRVFTFVSAPYPASSKSNYMVLIEEQTLLNNIIETIVEKHGLTVKKHGSGMCCGCFKPLDEEKKEDKLIRHESLPWSDLCKEFGIDPNRVLDKV